MEQRQHKRVPFAGNVMLLLDSGAPPLLRRGLVSGISFGGIGLYLPQPAESGVRVKLENRFLMPGGEFVTETIKGKVLYSKPIRDTYLVGIEFDDELNPKNQPDLYNRIQDILKSY